MSVCRRARRPSGRPNSAISNSRKRHKESIPAVLAGASSRYRCVRCGQFTGVGALFTLVRAPKRGRYVGETSCPASADGEGALPGLTRVFRLTKMGSYLSYPCTGTDDTGRLHRRQPLHPADHPLGALRARSGEHRRRRRPDRRATFPGLVKQSAGLATQPSLHRGLQFGTVVVLADRRGAVGPGDVDEERGCQFIPSGL